MKKFFKRSFAYITDILIIEIILALITNISFINPQKEKYSKYYNEYSEVYNEYYNYLSKLSNYYEDEELTEKEYNKLMKLDNDFNADLEKYYDDNKLSKKEYNKLVDSIQDDFEDSSVELQYKITKYSTISYIVYIVLILIYFVGFNILTKGETIGKKLFKLKIVKKDGSDAGIINYVLRSIILYDMVFYVLYIILVNTLSCDSFYNCYLYINKVQSIVQLLIVLLMIVRIDGRGLQDIIGGTKVILFDKDGNIIPDDNISIFGFNLFKNKNTIDKDNIENKSSKTKKNNKVIEGTIEEEDEDK